MLLIINKVTDPISTESNLYFFRTLQHESVQTMRVVMDQAGCVRIPKRILRRAGLKPGMTLTVELQNGNIGIAPANDVELIRRGRFLIAVSKKPVPPLTNKIVERTRKILRRSFA